MAAAKQIWEAAGWVNDRWGRLKVLAAALLAVSAGALIGGGFLVHRYGLLGAISISVGAVLLVSALSIGGLGWWYRSHPTATPSHDAVVGKSGFSNAEIEALEQRRREQKLRDHQKKVVDDQLWWAKHYIRDHVWPIGQANNMELARLVQEWIAATEKIIRDAIGESDAVVFGLDVGDPGLVAGAAGQTELDMMKAIQKRYLERLDRHIVRLQTIRDRL